MLYGRRIYGVPVQTDFGRASAAYTRTLLTSLFSIWPALLSPTLGSPAKASEEPKAWGPLLTALWRRYCARSKIKI